MSLFVILGLDAPGSDETRARLRAEHLTAIRALRPQIRLAGPCRDAAGRHSGSLLIVEAESAAAARALIEADPFFAAGVFRQIEVLPFIPATGDWAPAAG